MFHHIELFGNGNVISQSLSPKIVCMLLFIEREMPANITVDMSIVKIQ